jgi:hypothetical protein
MNRRRDGLFANWLTSLPLFGPRLEARSLSIVAACGGKVPSADLCVN